MLLPKKAFPKNQAINPKSNFMSNHVTFQRKKKH